MPTANLNDDFDNDALGGLMTSPADTAIARMRSPRDMQIICVDITNRCNLSCSNCTRLLANQDGLWDMTPGNFRKAVRSLRDFPGTLAIIGGNPTMHRDFEALCEILVEEIPEKERRGLWTSHAYKHTDLAIEVFGVFNLNPHGDPKSVESLSDLYTRSEGVRNLYEGHSQHAPLLAAIKDIYGEEEMWERIAACDVNQNWSASVTQVRGELRAYFCEVAAAFDVARGTDNGHEVVEGWWRRPITDYADQIKHFCPGCGAAARLAPTRDADDLDTYTASNQDLVERSLRRKRKVQLLDIEEARTTASPITTYNPEYQKGRPVEHARAFAHRIRRLFVRT